MGETYVSLEPAFKYHEDSQTPKADFALAKTIKACEVGVAGHTGINCPQAYFKSFVKTLARENISNME
jgi:hypothetical protein